MRTLILGSFLTLISSMAFGHAHMVSPAPRNPDPSIKIAPCGPYAKAAVPATTVTAGATLAVAWQETINHPGKYIFTWMQMNDTPIVGVPQVMIPDNQDGAGLPHNYTANLIVPNVPCANCTLQLVQSMEENPAAPTFYYSCVDIRILAAGGTTGTPTPTPGATPTPFPTITPPGTGVVTQSSTAKYNGETVVVGGGCGTIARHQSGGGGFGGTGGGLLALLLPFMTFLFLRSLQEKRKRVGIRFQ